MESNINQKNKRRVKVIFFTITSLAILLGVVANLSLPLPISEQGAKVVQGKIQSCKISTIGGGATKQLYVGITLNNKLFKLNTSLSVRSLYTKLCQGHPLVKISYHANRLLVRPEITYWIDTIQRIKSNS